MGWDKGRYYTQSKKINGRVVRVYVGAGRAGESVARMDALMRAERDAGRIARKVEQEEHDAIEADVRSVVDLGGLAAKAALMAAGYHQHKRGEWRKRKW